MEERKPLRAPALDPATVAPSGPTTYPAPFRALVAARERRRLGDALGLKNFGVKAPLGEPAARGGMTGGGGSCGSIYRGRYYGS